MSIQSQKATQRHYGAGDKPLCSSCGKEMKIIRRSPDTWNPSDEVQTFSCMTCPEELTRIVDASGNPRG